LYNGVGVEYERTIEMKKWDLEISSKTFWWKWNLKEVWRYRDLLLLLVMRDYKASFRQTILGPIWFFIQPIFTTIVYTFVFNRVAKLGTDNQPPALFYLSGVILWNYFSTSLTSTSNAFIQNASIFGKVYFPRLIIPVSIVLSNLMKFSVQLAFFICMLIYYTNFTMYTANMSWHIVLVPLLVLNMALLGLGAGMIISSFTTKYRDLAYLVTFGVQLLMYATPVVYPLSMVKGKLLSIILLNPMTGIVEGFRYGFLGTGSFEWGMLAYSFSFAAVMLVIAISLFNRVEKSFMDTV
jgi:lipopolysaccharide transport system permease protein